MSRVRHFATSACDERRHEHLEELFRRRGDLFAALVNDCSFSTAVARLVAFHPPEASATSANACAAPDGGHRRYLQVGEVGRQRPRRALGRERREHVLTELVCARATCSYSARLHETIPDRAWAPHLHRIGEDRHHMQLAVRARHPRGERPIVGLIVNGSLGKVGRANDGELVGPQFVLEGPRCIAAARRSAPDADWPLDAAVRGVISSSVEMGANAALFSPAPPAFLAPRCTMSSASDRSRSSAPICGRMTRLAASVSGSFAKEAVCTQLEDLLKGPNGSGTLEPNAQPACRHACTARSMRSWAPARANAGVGTRQDGSERPRENERQLPSTLQLVDPASVISGKQTMVQGQQVEGAADQ